MTAVTNSCVHYQIQLASPHHHYFDVELTIEQPDPQGQGLELPNWIPGSYMIRDFAKHIIYFEANSPLGTLTYTRPSKSSWQLAAATGPLQIKYRVYAFDSSIRAAYLDHTYGFFNASSLCLSIVGQEHLPHRIQVSAPEPKFQLQNWQLATGMKPVSVAASGFGCYEAANYQELLDYPVLMGELTHIPFVVNSIPHELILVGKHYANKKALAQDLTNICEAQQSFFGGPPDFQQYKFLTIVTGQSYGGLEHINSTALMCPREALEPGTQSEPSDAYLEFLSLCSHEYFHNWNIKRLKPKSFQPYQLQRESYTEQLWFYEGFTSFYDDLFVYRAACISAERYLERLANTITRGLRGLGPSRQSLVESSQLAWTTFYQQNENSVNAISNYYSKGAVVALCLDLLLRSTSQGKVSLDTVMQTAWQEFGLLGHGTEQADLLRLCNPQGHEQIQSFLQTALYTTADLPWQKLLAEFGVRVEFSALDTFNQQPLVTALRPNLELGAALQETPAGLLVTRIIEDGAAALAGLSAGDVLIALDGLQASRAVLQQAQHRFQVAETITIHYFRDHCLRQGQLTWQTPRHENVLLSLFSAEHSLPW